MAQGTVKWFNKEKGFGFIVDPQVATDIFVHYSEIKATGYRILVEGESVEYDLEHTERGVKALNVVKIDQEWLGEKDRSVR